MSAGRYNFIIEKGTTIDFQINYKDSMGNPIDLTSYEGAMQVATGYSGEGEVLLSLTSSLGDSYQKLPNNSFLSFSGSNLQTDPISGSIGIYIGYELTSELNTNCEESLYYDLEITKDGIRIRVIEGRISLSPEVTSINP